jgi:hypothetical protein
MSSRIWGNLLTEHDSTVSAAGGRGAHAVFGQRTLGQCLYFNQRRPPHTDRAMV